MAEAEPEEVCVEPLPDLGNIEALLTIEDPEHWYNYIWNLPENAVAYNVLNTGVPVLDFLRRPTHKIENFEWLAFILHCLIDRVSIFYDFVILRCNDGFRELNFTDPLFYGSEITLANVDRDVKNFLMEENKQCSFRVKIATGECLPVDDDIIQDYPMMEFPTKVHDAHHSTLGASSYIQKMITKLKTLRDNNFTFPTSLDNYISATFEGAARYMLFHLITIMSHITTCHFKEIADQKLNRHLFTLNAWIFSIGVQYNFLPPSLNISSEFVLLCRHLLHVDSLIEYRVRPEIPAIPIEGELELPNDSDESEHELNQPGQSGNSNMRDDNVEPNEAAVNNNTDEDAVTAPKAMREEMESLLRKNISRTECNVVASVRSRSRKRSRNK